MAVPKLTTLDRLKLSDTACKPLPGTITLCLMCGKPFLMRKYSGYPDQVCPECFETYKDCASVICNKCQVVIAKVKPSVLPSGFYVRPRSVLHIPFCNVCAPPLPDIKEGDIACVSYIIEVKEYEERMGVKKKIIVPMRGTNV